MTIKSILYMDQQVSCFFGKAYFTRPILKKGFIRTNTARWRRSRYFIST